MTQATTETESQLAANSSEPSWVRWAVFVGPLAVFMLVGSLLPSGLETLAGIAPDSPTSVLTVTIVRLVAMLAVIGWALPRVRRSFALSIHPLAIVVGLMGGVMWIVLCGMQLEASILAALGWSADALGQRDAVNPWQLFSDPIQRNVFLTARFALLIVAVPVAEEWMLRGCLMRAVESDDWDTLPLSRIGMTGWIAATVYAMVSHPSEWIAAAVWFSLITWWMVRTHKLWDCVVAHAVTNAMLGVYIVVCSDWRLW